MRYINIIVFESQNKWRDMIVKLAIKYALFAAISTIGNLSTQQLF